MILFFFLQELTSLHDEHQCLTGTWVVLLHTVNFTAFIALQVYRKRYLFLQLKMCMLWTQGPSISFVILCINLKQLLDEQEQKQYFLHDQTLEGLQISAKSFVKIVWFSLSIPEVDYVVATKSTKTHFRNSLSSKRAMSWFAYFEKVSLNLSSSSFVIHVNFSILSAILVPLWFIIISLVFFYLSKLLFSAILQFKGKFVPGQNNSKYHD